MLALVRAVTRFASKTQPTTFVYPTSATSDGATTSEDLREAERAGRAWAQAVKAELRGDSRFADGGWPGTMSEAKLRAHHLRQAAQLGPQGRTRLAVVLYQAAQHQWSRR